MEQFAPRVLLAGTGSGCGKTTVTCGILQALVNRGVQVSAFKCGPDYIDPMFHSRIIGAKSSNLDPFFFDQNTLRTLLAENSAGSEVSVIEGAMGYYDGAGLSSRASSWETASATDSPAVLVIPAKGVSISVLAVLEGFLHFQTNSYIKGVILNRCTAMTYTALAEQIQQYFGDAVEPLGFLPDVPECGLESRHLGLVTAAEVENLREKMQILAEQIEKSVNLDALLRLANSAGKLEYVPLVFEKRETVRVAVARDKAFCFYYEDSLHILEKLGAELVDFSPLSDENLPENVHGLYLGGGYPELYGEALSKNVSIRYSIKKALKNGLPCIAECGGFMYLTEQIGDWPMVGYLPGKCWDNHKLTRFGYVTLQAGADNLLCRKGEEIRGHEFHHWDTEKPGEAFTAAKLNGRSWKCAYASERLYAGYPHFHFYANPQFAENFYAACLEEKHHYARNFEAF